MVDDHTLFRQGLSALLQEFSDIHIAFEAANGKELQELLPHQQQIDVVLMDINMPVMNGYEATEWLTAQHPEIQVLALSMFDDEVAIIKMLKAGAKGYVLKESTPAELHNAIFSIVKNGFYANELVNANTLKTIETQQLENNVAYNFSSKELSFLQYCASELTYKEIAHAMGVAHRTVDNYRESLFIKLDIKSRVGLVLWGIKQGLIKL